MTFDKPPSLSLFSGTSTYFFSESLKGAAVSVIQSPKKSNGVAQVTTEAYKVAFPPPPITWEGE